MKSDFRNLKVERRFWSISIFFAWFNLFIIRIKTENILKKDSETIKEREPRVVCSTIQSLCSLL